MTLSRNDNLVLVNAVISGSRVHDNGFPSAKSPTNEGIIWIPCFSIQGFLSVHPLDDRRIVYQGTHDNTRCFWTTRHPEGKMASQCHLKLLDVIPAAN